MVTKTLIRKLRTYAESIQREGIPVDALILYGSRASGKSARDSDIDVCVVSEKFGADPVEEGCFLQRIAHRIDPLIEPLAFSLSDYRTNTWLPILHAIRKNGVRIV